MQDSIRLHYRRLYILPTKRGMGFVALLVLLVTIAAIYNNNLVYLLSFLLASIFFITILHTVKSLEGIVLKKGHNPAVFLGENTQNQLILDNPTNTARFSVQVNLLNQTPQIIDINAQDKNSVLLKQITTQRGWHQSSTLIIASLYPLGLFRTWIKPKLEFKTLVYPRPSANSSPFPSSHISDDAPADSSQGQDDFYGVQSYQAGDSPRKIHWRALAKGQGLYSKQYSGESRANELILDYELTTGADSEQRLSQLCRWVIDAHQANIPYAFKLGSLHLETHQGEQHYQQCLEALALF